MLLFDLTDIMLGIQLVSRSSQCLVPQFSPQNMCRRYKRLSEERREGRRRFRSRHPGRNGHRGAPYPLEIPEFPSFPDWLEAEVQTCLDNNVEVPQNVINSSKPPSLVA